MSRRIIAVVAVIVTITLGRPAFAQVQSCDSVTASGGSIVEQLGCDITCSQTIKDPVTGTSTERITVNRSCQVTDFVNLFIYLSKWGMSVLAILAVGMFIYGGLQFITAAGRSSKVDEGKRVLVGTIVGVIISLTGYVIINTAVAAFTGTSIRSNNPFGVVSSVFGGQDTSTTIQGQTIQLTKPFSGKQSSSSGSGSGTTSGAACLTDSSWDHTCSSTNLQSNCADTTSDSTIKTMQAKLEEKGCSCGGANGCFSTDTTACVRTFQLSNNLPPTGVINGPTKDLILNNPNAKCTDAGAAVAAKLPAPVRDTGDSISDLGCCIVTDGSSDLYCIDSTSSRGCKSSGANTEFKAASGGSGKCASIPEAAGRCGYCSNRTQPSTSDPLNACFMGGTFNWCHNISDNTTEANGPNYFKTGSCNGSCRSCLNTLQINL